MMLTESSIARTSCPWIDSQPPSAGEKLLRRPRGVFCEKKWRQLELDEVASGEDILISRWNDLRNICRFEEALTPPDHYVISIALKTTRLNLTTGRQIIFDGVMPAGSLHVSSPSKRLRAQFQAPFDFLHFHISSGHFPTQTGEQADPIDHLNNLVLLRDPFAEQLAKALTEDMKATDRQFVRSVGQTLAMHIVRLEPLKTKINALPKWRLKRVEDYVVAHFDRRISLSDMAKVAGLSRMHFAAQFRVATGYRPREFLLHQRVEQAKSLLSNTDTPLAAVALAVGFCTQAHFSTVFRRLTGETPARWRSIRKGHYVKQPSSVAFAKTEASRSGIED